MKDDICVDCGKACCFVRCKKCAIRYYHKNLKIGIKTERKCYCLDCKKLISWGSIRCNSCSIKAKWKERDFRKRSVDSRIRKWAEDVEYRAKTCSSRKITNKLNWLNEDYVKKVVSALNLKPNKQEQLLIRLLTDDWKYVGNGLCWMQGINPDFKHKELNLLIELFGDYWHRGETGSERIEHFRKQGYETLIIWEHELKNPDQVLARVDEFVSKNSLQMAT